MRIVKGQEAKTTLSRLLVAFEAGEEIVIARGDKPVAKLVAPKSWKTLRKNAAARSDLEEPLRPLPDDPIDLIENSLVGIIPRPTPP